MISNLNVDIDRQIVVIFFCNRVISISENIFLIVLTQVVLMCSSIATMLYFLRLINIDFYYRCIGQSHMSIYTYLPSDLKLYLHDFIRPRKLYTFGDIWRWKSNKQHNFRWNLHFKLFICALRKLYSHGNGSIY